VKAATRLIPYPEQRAVEDVAFAQQAVPTRIFAFLMPVWRVQIKATVTEGEPYDLIDWYLERGIAEGRLRTAGELAEFFALDPVLVDRALRFLRAIGHVTVSGEHLALTDLGDRSVREKVRYFVTRQDRRTLYFDAFASRPLTRPYYDPRAVTLLEPEAADGIARGRDWPRFTPLFSRDSRHASPSWPANSTSARWGCPTCSTWLPTPGRAASPSSSAI